MLPIHFRLMYKKLLLASLILLQTIGALAQKPGSLTALEFDGTDDYVLVPDNTALNPTTKITVEAWIKADAFATSNFGNSIFCKHGWASGNKGYVLRCGDGRINFNISNSSGVWVEAVTASILKTGVWYHVAGTFNGDTIAVYINGNLEATTLYSGVMSPSTGLAPKIGDMAYTAGGSRLFKGQIDEVRVWNNALTKATLRDWMCRKAIKTHPNYSNLAGYYKLDEGTGVNAKDNSSYGNTATLMNGPRWVNSGAALGDSSAYVYSGTSFSLPTKFGDVFTVKNINGAPVTVHAYLTYDTTVQAAAKTVSSSIDSTHFFGVYYSDNSAVNFDINYNIKNLNSLVGAKKCGVDMLVKTAGNTGTWNSAPSKLYDNGDSLVLKKQTKNEFVMALYKTDSTKLLTTNTGKQWFCGGDSLLLITSGNDSFNYVWYKNGGVLNGKSKKTLWVSSLGNYKVKLTRRGTSCSFTSTDITITSRSTAVTWSYSINACENSDSIKLTQGTPSGGYFSGKWVTSNGYFHPKLAGAGTRTIFYNYVDTNNCINKASLDATLLDTTKLIFTPPAPLCTNSLPVNLTIVTPSGGIYQGKGVTTNKFYPAVAGLGTHAITYSYTKTNSCKSKAVFNISINKPDSMSVIIKDKGCIYDDPIAVHLFPIGGVLKGSAVIGTIFYPLFANKGWNLVFYTITDSHQCNVKDSAKIYISEAPIAKLEKFASVCDNVADFNLSGGQPADSGKYWVENVLSAKFSPITKGKGLYKIDYKVVNYFGCRDSASSYLRVNASPLKPTITITKNTLTSSSPKGNQWLNKSGPILGANQQDYSPLIDGYYFVQVTNDSNCSAKSDSVQFAKVGVNTIHKSNVIISPNPSNTGVFNIKGLLAHAEIKVMDRIGKELIYLFKHDLNTFIDLTSFGPGSFLISIKSDEQWYNYRVVVL